MAYPIEDGIPIPAARSGTQTRRGPRCELAVALNRMGPMQSLIVDTPQEFEKARAIFMRIKASRFTSRKTRSGWRIWRLE